MKPFKCEEIIRFRRGASALMKVERVDRLCGYITYHGTHLYGEQISIAGCQCSLASEDDLKTWLAFWGERMLYKRNLEKQFG